MQNPYEIGFGTRRDYLITKYKPFINSLPGTRNYKQIR